MEVYLDNKFKVHCNECGSDAAIIKIWTAQNFANAQVECMDCGNVVIDGE